jgi:hypothetical protein
MTQTHSKIIAYEGKQADVQHRQNTQFLILKIADVAGCQHALFEWAESYDTKDWDRLAQCVAPTLHV